MYSNIDYIRLKHSDTRCKPHEKIVYVKVCISFSSQGPGNGFLLHNAILDGENELRLRIRKGSERDGSKIDLVSDGVGSGASGASRTPLELSRSDSESFQAAVHQGYDLLARQSGKQLIGLKSGGKKWHNRLRADVGWPLLNKQNASSRFLLRFIFALTLLIQRTWTTSSSNFKFSEYTV